MLPVYGSVFFVSSLLKHRRRRTNRNSVPAIFAQRMILFRHRSCSFVPSLLTLRNRMKICGVISIAKVIAALAISDSTVLHKLDLIIERITVQTLRSSVQVLSIGSRGVRNSPSGPSFLGLDPRNSRKIIKLLLVNRTVQIRLLHRRRGSRRSSTAVGLSSSQALRQSRNRSPVTNGGIARVLNAECLR